MRNDKSSRVISERILSYTANQEDLLKCFITEIDKVKIALKFPTLKETVLESISLSDDDISQLALESANDTVKAGFLYEFLLKNPGRIPTLIVKETVADFVCKRLKDFIKVNPEIINQEQVLVRILDNQELGMIANHWEAIFKFIASDTFKEATEFYLNNKQVTQQIIKQANSDQLLELSLKYQAVRNFLMGDGQDHFNRLRSAKALSERCETLLEIDANFYGQVITLLPKENSPEKLLAAFNSKKDISSKSNFIENLSDESTLSLLEGLQTENARKEVFGIIVSGKKSKQVFQMIVKEKKLLVGLLKGSESARNFFIVTASAQELLGLVIQSEEIKKEFFQDDKVKYLLNWNDSGSHNVEECAEIINSLKTIDADLSTLALQFVKQKSTLEELINFTKKLDKKLRESFLDENVCKRILSEATGKSLFELGCEIATIKKKIVDDPAASLSIITKLGGYNILPEFYKQLKDDDNRKFLRQILLKNLDELLKYEEVVVALLESEDFRSQLRTENLIAILKHDSQKMKSAIYQHFSSDYKKIKRILRNIAPQERVEIIKKNIDFFMSLVNNQSDKDYFEGTETESIFISIASIAQLQELVKKSASIRTCLINETTSLDAVLAKQFSAEDSAALTQWLTDDSELEVRNLFSSKLLDLIEKISQKEHCEKILQVYDTDKIVEILKSPKCDNNFLVKTHGVFARLLISDEEEGRNFRAQLNDSTLLKLYNANITVMNDALHEAAAKENYAIVLKILSAKSADMYPIMDRLKSPILSMLKDAEFCKTQLTKSGNSTILQRLLTINDEEIKQQLWSACATVPVLAIHLLELDNCSKEELKNHAAVFISALEQCKDDAKGKSLSYRVINEKLLAVNDSALQKMVFVNPVLCATLQKNAHSFTDQQKQWISKDIVIKDTLDLLYHVINYDTSIKAVNKKQNESNHSDLPQVEMKVNISNLILENPSEKVLPIIKELIQSMEDKNSNLSDQAKAPLKTLRDRVWNNLDLSFSNNKSQLTEIVGAIQSNDQGKKKIAKKESAKQPSKELQKAKQNQKNDIEALKNLLDKVAKQLNKAEKKAKKAGGKTQEDNLANAVAVASKEILEKKFDDYTKVFLLLRLNRLALTQLPECDIKNKLRVDFYAYSKSAIEHIDKASKGNENILAKCLSSQLVAELDFLQNDQNHHHQYEFLKAQLYYAKECALLREQGEADKQLAKAMLLLSDKTLSSEEKTECTRLCFSIVMMMLEHYANDCLNVDSQINISAYLNQVLLADLFGKDLFKQFPASLLEKEIICQRLSSKLLINSAAEKIEIFISAVNPELLSAEGKKRHQDLSIQLQQLKYRSIIHELQNQQKYQEAAKQLKEAYETNPQCVVEITTHPLTVLYTENEQIIKHFLQDSTLSGHWVRKEEYKRDLLKVIKQNPKNYLRIATALYSYQHFFKHLTLNDQLDLSLCLTGKTDDKAEQNSVQQATTEVRIVYVEKVVTQNNTLPIINSEQSSASLVDTSSDAPPPPPPPGPPPPPPPPPPGGKSSAIVIAKNQTHSMNNSASSSTKKTTAPRVDLNSVTDRAAAIAKKFNWSNFLTDDECNGHISNTFGYKTVTEKDNAYDLENFNQRIVPELTALIRKLDTPIMAFKQKLGGSKSKQEIQKLEEKFALEVEHHFNQSYEAFIKAKLISDDYRENFKTKFSELFTTLKEKLMQKADAENAKHVAKNPPKDSTVTPSSNVVKLNSTTDRANNKPNYNWKDYLGVEACDRYIREIFGYKKDKINGEQYDLTNFDKKIKPLLGELISELKGYEKLANNSSEVAEFKRVLLEKYSTLILLLLPDEPANIKTNFATRFEQDILNGLIGGILNKNIGTQQVDIFQSLNRVILSRGQASGENKSDSDDDSNDDDWEDTKITQSSSSAVQKAKSVKTDIQQQVEVEKPMLEENKPQANLPQATATIENNTKKPTLTATPRPVNGNNHSATNQFLQNQQNTLKRVAAKQTGTPIIIAPQSSTKNEDPSITSVAAKRSMFERQNA